jgi:hypothetical protein
MAHATEMNSAHPMPSAGSFRAQMEGMVTAALYILFFGWIHLGATTELVSARVLAVFFGGLIVIPLVTGLPLGWLRHLVADGLERRSSIAAFLPFARFALYALQAIVVWVATREAYAWIFTAAAAN